MRRDQDSSPSSSSDITSDFFPPASTNASTRAEAEVIVDRIQDMCDQLRTLLHRKTTTAEDARMKPVEAEVVESTDASKRGMDRTEKLSTTTTPKTVVNVNNNRTDAWLRSGAASKREERQWFNGEDRITATATINTATNDATAHVLENDRPLNDRSGEEHSLREDLGSKKEKQSGKETQNAGKRREHAEEKAEEERRKNVNHFEDDVKGDEWEEEEEGEEEEDMSFAMLNILKFLLLL